ncbi:MULTISPECIES: hypothetical protein [Streptomyces]|uniref:Head-to-tail stopper n=1 Tax=Streptomyces dengpaensis TaxID=2049881 RepID=A0ABM6SZ94_9ACTN|nr:MULTISPECIES: hypothetical protein [Streptomyces]AVH59990.1 hypothetical protein C4B68_34130 [Streptomyces dengpaensis]PIB09628.1 hypothetical protein B1C81_10805 [Streptomyces sp. HG99]
MASITTKVRQHLISLRLQGAPDVENRHGPGVLRPTEVRVTYWYDGDEATTPDATVRLFGLWVSEGGEGTDHVMDQSYTGPQRNWPEWLVEIVRVNQPKTRR